MVRKQGKQTYITENMPSIISYASIGGKKESEGPMAAGFDMMDTDTTFGTETWEKAESRMVTMTVKKAIEKAGLTESDIPCVFAGDLLNQCVGTTFGLRDIGIPMLGIYGACSTMSQGILMASLMVESKVMPRAMAVTSSHFCTAERQYRFPLEYGSVRPPTSQWTATAAGAVIIEEGIKPPFIKAVTIGTVEDLGVTDQNNRGAAMAPAAAKTITQFFKDTNKTPDNFDLIATGNLGLVGSELLIELAARSGFQIKSKHIDCGLLIYDREKQDVHAGGSGCGCSAAVLCSYLIPSLREGKIKDLLFVATGALLSPTTVQQKESIPSIAHLVWLSSSKGGLQL